MEDYEEYQNRAKLFTQIYATVGNKGIGSGSLMNKESYNTNLNVSFNNKQQFSLFRNDLRYKL